MGGVGARCPHPPGFSAEKGTVGTTGGGMNGGHPAGSPFGNIGMAGVLLGGGPEGNGMSSESSESSESESSAPGGGPSGITMSSSLSSSESSELSLGSGDWAEQG